MKIMRNTATRRGKQLLAATAFSAAALTALLIPGPADAHAIAGNRVFPATMAVDDPGVSDEFDSQYGHLTVPETTATRPPIQCGSSGTRRLRPALGSRSAART